MHELDLKVERNIMPLVMKILKSDESLKLLEEMEGMERYKDIDVQSI